MGRHTYLIKIRGWDTDLAKTRRGLGAFTFGINPEKDSMYSVF